jgi:glycosidase
VVLDAVFNHTGTSFHEFSPFLNGREGWYIGHGDRESYHGRYDMKKRRGMKPSYETWEGVGSLPKLNLSNPVVRKYLLSVLSYWTRYAKVDGWRFDVGESLPLDFLLEARHLLRSINPDSYLLGEVWKNPSFWLEDAFYDATMNYVLREAVLLFAEQKIGAGSFINRVYDVYAHVPLSASVSQYNLLGSHDTSRIATVLNSNKKKIALVLAILFSLPGAPAIYYGDEFMMKGAGGDNARGTINWSSKQTFSEIISSLCLLRSKNRELCSGIFEANCRNGSLIIRRSIGPHSVIFACCNVGGNRSIDIEGTEIISSGAVRKGSRIMLKPFGWIFLRSR